jgi:hypothetical protein
MQCYVLYTLNMLLMNEWMNEWMNELINEYQRFDSPDDKTTCGPAALVIPRFSVNSELGSEIEH